MKGKKLTLYEGENSCNTRYIRTAFFIKNLTWYINEGSKKKYHENISAFNSCSKIFRDFWQKSSLKGTTKKMVLKEIFFSSKLKELFSFSIRVLFYLIGCQGNFSSSFSCFRSLTTSRNGTKSVYFFNFLKYVMVQMHAVDAKIHLRGVQS